MEFVNERGDVLLVYIFGIYSRGKSDVGEQERCEADVRLCVEAVLGEPLLQHPLI